MKIVKFIITLFFLCIFVLQSAVFAVEIMNEELDLKVLPAHQLNLKSQVKQDKKSLLVDEDTSLEQIVDEQKKKDLEDLEKLWTTTVEKNTLIQFTLKKLAVPESERRIHSSFMAKSVSALISGASFLPSFTGMNYSLQTASLATGKLLNNYLNKKNVPQTQPLSDTELIELAGVIENLQDNIINSYYNYKGALLELKQIRTKLILYNKNYAKAISRNDNLEMIISAAAYDDMLVEEFKAKESAKKYQMELERLTDQATVKSLNLYAKDVSDELLDVKLFSSDKRKG